MGRSRPPQKKRVYNGESMDLEEHYKSLLYLGEGWRVERVKHNKAHKRVDIWLEHGGGAVRCPECQTEGTCYGREPERSWRHLDTMESLTVLHAAAPRVDCRNCGVRSAGVPWAEKHSRFTLHFEARAVEALEACRSKSEGARLLGLGWRQASGIMKRAVERGTARREEVEMDTLGIGDKSFLRGQSYASVLVDIEGGRVLDVVEGRTIADAQWLLMTALTPRQRRMVCATAMDMSDAYEAAVRSMLPNSDIVHDKFHIAKHLSEMVDQVRRREHAMLKGEGDNSLAGTRYQWLRSAQSMGEEQRREFERLNRSSLDVAKAWRIKELFAEFWTRRDKQSARSFFGHWLKEAMATGLQPIKRVAEMLAGRLGNILTYFDTFITNAAAEGFNSKIQSLKANARGFRSFDNYRTTILFFCGGLDLRPNLPCASPVTN